MNLSLGISPCPNDTFIFESLLFENILPDVQIKHHLEDVETLNKRALNGDYDVTKLSFAAYLKVADKYQLLDSGAALGMGCGPMLVAADPIMLESLRDASIAVPGENTTANFLSKFALKFPFKAKQMPFDKVQDAILEGEVDAGVIIHENRFTYQDNGLYLLEDLGNVWEAETGMPIPLGGIAVKRDLDESLKVKLEKALALSVTTAQAKDGFTAFVKSNAQEMSEEVLKEHINLYVNDFSISLGVKGRQAIDKFAAIAVEKGWIDAVPENMFVS